MVSPQPVEAIERALRILKALEEAGPTGLALGDLAERIGLNKSTVYRAVSTLRLHSYVFQVGDSGRYCLGSAAISLGAGFLEEDNLPQMLHPLLVHLSAELGELVHLGVPLGSGVLYVDKVEPERAIQVRSRIGQTIPAISSAMGRAILSQKLTDQKQLLPYLADLKRDFSRREGDAEVSGLWGLLQEAKEKGYAHEIEENEAGVACFGVALLYGQRIVGAISVTGLVERMNAGYIGKSYGLVFDYLRKHLPAGFSLPAGKLQK